jgi:hypothetical protein
MDLQWQLKNTVLHDSREHIPKATGTSAELHVGFKAMVNGLYDIIEKDGLMDPFTGKPAGVNFLDKNSFIQKLNLHAQEFQMAVIILSKNSSLNTLSITMATLSIGSKKYSNHA